MPNATEKPPPEEVVETNEPRGGGNGWWITCLSLAAISYILSPVLFYLLLGLGIHLDAAPGFERFIEIFWAPLSWAADRWDPLERFYKMLADLFGVF